MDIIINNKNNINVIVKLTPAIVQNLEPTFGPHGRRYSYQEPGKVGQGFKDLCLNDLILAVKNSPIKSEHNINEVKAFVHVFKSIKSKGYGYNSPLDKLNFLTRLITRIKHFFSEMKRIKILKDLVQQTLPPHLVEIKVPNRHQFALEAPDDDEPKAGPLEPFNFVGLPEDMQYALLSQVDSQSLLSVYRTSKKSRALIEKRLSKELKKAQLKEQAYIEFQNSFSTISSTLDSYPKEFVALTHEFAPSYSKELLKKFKRAFIRLNNPENKLGGMGTLIQASQELSLSYPKTLTQWLEQTINIQEVLPGKFARIADCLKIIASFDPKKALSLFLQSKLIMDKGLIDYRNLTFTQMIHACESHLDELFESINEIADERLKTSGFIHLFAKVKLDNKYLPLIQKVLDASQTFSDENKTGLMNRLASHYSQLGEFDKSMELIKKMKFLVELKYFGIPQESLILAIKSCVKIHKDPKEVDSFLQNILLFIRQEDVNKKLKQNKTYGWSWENILIELALAFTKTDSKQAKLLLEELDLDQLNPLTLEDVVHAYIPIDIDKAKELLKRVKPSFRKNELLKEMAKTYVGQDVEKVKAILDEMDLPAHDTQLSEVSKACISIDIEKAKEIAHKIGAIDIKIATLLDISDVLKKDNLEEANDIWENALNLSLMFAIPHLQCRTILDIVHQKAEIDPKQAKQFLEAELIEISRRNLFIEMAKGNTSHLNKKDFVLFASVYAKLYPAEVEALIKSKDLKWAVPPIIKTQVLLAIANAI